jgi:hypothetical protein
MYAKADERWKRIVNVGLHQRRNVMRNRMWSLLSLLLLITMMGASMLVVAPQVAHASPSDYRVPLIGDYTLARMDPTASSNCAPVYDSSGDLVSGHTGVGRYMDINGNSQKKQVGGDPVYASGDGTITAAGWDTTGYGYSVLLQATGGEVTFNYGHLYVIYVTKDQSVSKGDLIGLMGTTGFSTGNHLHWEARSASSPYTSFNIFDIPGVDEEDPLTPCAGNNDGIIHGPDLPTSRNPYNSCSIYFAINDQQVNLFDHSDCKGNRKTLSDGTTYDLTGNFQDRTRSIYVPLGKSVYVARDSNGNGPGACLNSTRWNLDFDKYPGVDVHIGWNYNGVTHIGDSPYGFNMISFARSFAVPDCKLTPTQLKVYDAAGFHSSFPSYAYAIDASRYYGVDPVLGGIGAAIFDPSIKNQTLLTTFATADVLPFDMQFHVVVANTGGSDYYDGSQICVGTSCNESTSLDWTWNWGTYGHDDGMYDVKLRYRTHNDGGNWANAEVIYDGKLYLSPVRTPYAPCSSNLDGVELTSGSDCIIVTQDSRQLGDVGWAESSNLQACINGDIEAWLYDDVQDQYGNHEGAPYVVNNVACKNLGSNISSVDIKDVSNTPPPVPAVPFAVDRNTVHLWHMEDSHVDYIADGDTVADSVSSGGQTGTVTSGQWVNGVSGNGLGFFTSVTGRGLTFSTMDVCPITYEGWIHFTSLSGSGNGRIAGQLGGGGNSGNNKWLLSLDTYRPKLEIWSNGGSQSATSFQGINDTNWHYLMATYDCTSKQAMLYLDNVVVGSLTSAATWNSGATTFEVGTTEASNRCDCELDEIRISNIVRVPSFPPSWGLLENGGFENLTSGWADNWTKSASSISVDTTAQGDQDGNSLHFTNNGSLTHADSERFPVKPNYGYSWKSYVKASSGSGEFGYYIDEYDSSGSWTSGQYKGNLTGALDGTVSWDYIPSSTSVVSASLQYYMNANTTIGVYVDSVSLSETGPVNLVPNGSFETLSSGWASNWTRNNTSVVTVDTGSKGNDGANSLYLAPSSSAHHAESALMTVRPGMAYNWISYMKSITGTGEFGFYIDEYNSSGTWISGQYVDSINGSIVREGVVSYRYVPSSTAVASASLQYYMNANTTFGVYVDSASFSEAGPENLATNGGFENLTSGWANNWTRNNTTGVTIDTGSNGNSGANSLHFTNVSSNHFGFGPEMQVKYGWTYTWSSYVKASSGSGEFGFYVDEYNSSHGWISGQWKGSITAAADGTYTFTYTPSSSSVAFASIQYYMNANTTIGVYVDNVSFTRTFP